MKGWEEFEIFAVKREEWFKQFLELPNGVPSHDTMYRVFSRINPNELNRTLIQWTNNLNMTVEGKIVAIDGKTLCHSFDSATGKDALHVVSAWIDENNLVLGQVADEGKGHEIAQIPKLLRLLELKDAIVTIDAIGCQKEITRVIREENMADYLIALKKNQPNLFNEVQHFFNVADKSQNFVTDFFKSVEKGHGRIEQRMCTCIDVGPSLDHVAEGFKDIKTVIKMHSIREINGKTEEQSRYFISSIPCNAKLAAYAIRKHWSIENSLHWRLDVVFREDESRIRKDHAPENMALIRRIAAGLVKARVPQKMSVKRAQLLMTLDWGFALKHFFTNN
jgi:predicted transposase YbfD/YdcC